METVKRVRYFDGEFLKAVDFTAEQEYHLAQQQRHNRLLHTAGIAEGLEVAGQNGSQIIAVTKGTAIDGAGQQIVLLEDISISIPGNITGSQKMLVVISLAQKGTDPDMNGGNTRYSEEPQIELVSTIRSEHVQLASVTVKDGKVQGAVDNSVRQIAVARLREDATLSKLTLANNIISPEKWPSLTCNAEKQVSVNGALKVFDKVILGNGLDVNAGEVTLSGALTVGQATTLKQGLLVASGNVGIGTLTPSQKLSVRGSESTPHGFGAAIGLENTSAGGSKWYLRVGATGTSTPTGGFSIADDDSYRLVIDQSGNVGIGVGNPSARLHLGGGQWDVTNTEGDLKVGNNDYNLKIGVALGGSGAGDVRIRAQGGTNRLMLGGGNSDALTIQNGNVGIGTNNPTKGKLEVMGRGISQHVEKYYYMAQSGTGSYAAVDIGYSIWTDGRIAAPEFNAISDIRIKDVIGISDARNDLAILKKIEIADYSYKDKISDGKKVYKKVIGQQVMKVFPQAVNNCVTDVVPDIMQKAYMESGIVQLKNHTLKPKDRIRLIFEDIADIFEIESVDQDSFTISAQKSGDVFVYGREVTDFHVVDYDAVSMLNVSATQEIARQLEALQTENAALHARVSAVEEENSLLRFEFMSLKGQSTALPAAS